MKVGPKRDKVRGDWRKLNNGKLHDLYSSPNIIQLVIFRRMIWAGHVAPMKRGEVHTGFWWGILR
jgi:hypothetical protein